MAKRHQLLESCNFGTQLKNENHHPLFAFEKKYGVLHTEKEDIKVQLQNFFDDLALLPGIDLTSVYRVSWIQIYGTKYRKPAVIAIDVDNNSRPNYFIDI